MPSLFAEDLGFSFDGAPPLFTGARFHLTPGFTGIVGANGAGKSTLLDLLAGTRQPTTGRVRRDPEWRVVRCDQGLAPPEGLAELAFSPDGADRRLLARLGLLDHVSVVERWESLSPGERKRWQLACALAAAPDLLLLDEPTNHLDEGARGWLVAALRGFRGVGVLVSHDRALLDTLCHDTLRVHAGQVTTWSGGYTAARTAWEAEAAERRDAHTRRQEDERRLRHRLGDARRVHAAAEGQRSTGARMKDRYDSDARGIMQQFRADKASAQFGRGVEVARAEHERARAALDESSWEEEVGRAVFLDWEPAPNPWLLTLDGPVTAGDTPIVAHASLGVARGDRIRVAGPNGAGKTTLIQALLDGARVPRERILQLPQELAPDQGRAWLAELRALPSDRRGAVLQLVAALGVDPARLLASAEPSYGEARKLGIALGLGRKVWLAVLDEPTNHLDLPSIERLQAALAAWPGALVLVSHDDTFAAACTRVTWVVGGGEVRVE